jgi:hypothetical protein
MEEIALLIGCVAASVSVYAVLQPKLSEWQNGREQQKRMDEYFHQLSQK